MRIHFHALAFALMIGSPAYAGGFTILPNPELTPGAIDPDATASVICVRGYTSGQNSKGNLVRDVPASVKTAIFKRYGIDPKSDKFEIDHLISLELGGSNDPNNLWPQSYTTTPFNAHVKDALEDRLHALVCSGKVDLREAQSAIARDWIAAYKKFVPGASK